MRKLFLTILVAVSMVQLCHATDITISRYTDNEWQGTHDWILFSSDDKYFFHFLIEVAEMQSGQTYTLADMRAEDSFVQNLSSMPFRDTYESASFTWTVDNKGKVSIVAEVSTLLHGDYVLRYSERLVGPAVDTTVIIMDKAYFYDHTTDNWFLAFEAANADYAIQLTCNSKDGIVGHYEGLGIYSEMGKLNEQATWLKRRRGEQMDSLVLVSAVADVTALEYGQYAVHAMLQDEDDHAYDILLSSVPRPGADTIQIVADNMQVREYMDGAHPQVSFQATGAELQVSLWVNSTSVDGEYYGSMINSVSIYSAVEQSEWGVSYDTGYIVVETVDNDVHLTGDVLMSDGNTYALDLTGKLAAEGVENISATSSSVTKRVVDGQMLLMVGEQIYTIQGQPINQ